MSHALSSAEVLGKIAGAWINADLCKADREAQFFARQQRRVRREQYQQQQQPHQ